MIALLIFTAWYIAGVVLFIWALYLQHPILTRRDIGACLVAGILGPMMLMYVLGEITHNSSCRKWWDKVVWPRKSPTAGESRE